MLPPNLNYGGSIFRRRVRLIVAPVETRVDLEDSIHAFRLALRHDGERITAIEAEFIRHPFTTCPGSRSHLAGLVGRRLDGLPEVRAAIETRLSCTHLMDMMALALAHWGEDGLVRLYDIAVDDERDGRMRARIDCDGRTVHDWTAARHAIIEPEALAGRPLMRGFHAWSREAFQGMPLEASMALQRGYFVAQARRYDPSPVQDHPAIGDGVPDGVCHSYSAPAVRQALRIEGSRRDFTNDPESLLTFRR